MIIYLTKRHIRSLGNRGGYIKGPQYSEDLFVNLRSSKNKKKLQKNKTELIQFDGHYNGIETPNYVLSVDYKNRRIISIGNISTTVKSKVRLSKRSVSIGLVTKVNIINRKNINIEINSDSVLNKEIERLKTKNDYKLNLNVSKKIYNDFIINKIINKSFPLEINKNTKSKLQTSVTKKSVSQDISFHTGENYKRTDLHEQYGGRRQSGISNCPKFPIIFIFTVDKHEQHGYKDGWDNDEYFWYSGEGTEGDMTFTGGNRSILNQQKDGKRIFLFKKSKKSGYWTFIDEFNLVDYRYYDVKDKNGDDRKGIQFKLLSITKKIEFDKIEKEQKISNTYNHNKPDKTEREGLVTSRVGQGFYRQQILEKWDSKCSVTGCELTKILISSHIVPWSKSNDSERLDVGNGLLLSPDLDSLFDKHLISFEDSGNIIISDKIDQDELKLLGININMELIFFI